MQNFGMSMLWFWTAYLIVTLIGVGHTFFNITVLHMKSMKDGPEWVRDLKRQNSGIHFIILSFFPCSDMYIHGLEHPSLQEAIMTGLIWAGICFVFDAFGWVMIKHPWSLTFKEFYVDYQPWISLIYLAIFLGPVIGFLV